MDKIYLNKTSHITSFKECGKTGNEIHSIPT